VVLADMEGNADFVRGTVAHMHDQPLAAEIGIDRIVGHDLALERLATQLGQIGEEGVLRGIGAVAPRAGGTAGQQHQGQGGCGGAQGRGQGFHGRYRSR